MLDAKESLVSNKLEGKVGICALCKEEASLKLSHRIPRSVGAIIKKNSFTKTLRSVHDPDKKLQDLDKDYMLCGKCEKRFGDKETLFVQKILNPYRNKRTVFLKYDSWLFYFITSLSWRTLYNDVSSGEDTFLSNGFSQKQYKKLQKTEIEMREYLLGKSNQQYNVENHLIFLSESTDFGEFSNIPYSEFCNATFGYVSGDRNTESLCVAHVMAGILVITVIKSYPKDKYTNSYVKNGAGKIAKQQRIRSHFVESELLEYIPQQLAQAREQMSDEEQSKLLQKIKRDREGFFRSSSSIKYR